MFSAFVIVFLVIHVSSSESEGKHIILERNGKLTIRFVKINLHILSVSMVFGQAAHNC